MTNPDSTQPIVNPFKGADPYSELDKQNFYGRDFEKNEMIRFVAQNTLTLLYSKSGIGKSSLLKAGVIPSLNDLKGYFPVFIRISDKMLSDLIPDFSTAVILLIQKVADEKGIKVQSDSEIKADTVAEFIYLSRFTKVENGEEYEMIPILILDQFEEIFSLDFQKNLLENFLMDLADLIESRVPVSLKTKFQEINKEDKLVSLKNRLENSNKWYRVVFSFREEYLPKFQSLKNKMPSVFHTKGKLYLETFSLPVATDVIEKISEESVALPKEIAEKLALIISKKGSEGPALKEEVQPFMLSLVCKNLYSKLVGPAANEIIVKSVMSEDESLVEKVIAKYFKKVFKKVSWQTKRYVEEKLVTEDDKRTMKAFQDIKSFTIREEMHRLWTDSDLRYLNQVEYFGSPHVEILHDRLVAPLVKSRNKRRLMERVLIGGVILGALVLGIYILNQSSQAKQNNREAYRAFFNKSNPKVLRQIMSEGKNNTIMALNAAFEYRETLDSLPNYDKDAFSAFQDSIATAFDSLYLFFKHEGDPQKYTTSLEGGTYRLKDTLINGQTIVEVERLSDAGYARKGIISLPNKGDRKRPPSNIDSFYQTKRLNNRAMQFLSDSIVYTTINDSVYFYNLSQNTRNGRFRDIYAISSDTYSFAFTPDNLNICTKRKTAKLTKTDTVFIYNLVSNNKTYVPAIPKKYSDAIFTENGYYSYLIAGYNCYDNKIFFTKERTSNSLNTEFGYVSDIIAFPGERTVVKSIDASNIFFLTESYIAAFSYYSKAFHFYDLGANDSKEKIDSAGFFISSVRLMNDEKKILLIGRKGELGIFDIKTGKITDLSKKMAGEIKNPDSLSSVYEVLYSNDKSKLLLHYYNYYNSASKARYRLELVDITDGRRIATFNNFSRNIQKAYIKNDLARLVGPDGSLVDWYYNYAPQYRFSQLDSFYRRLKTEKVIKSD